MASREHTSAIKMVIHQQLKDLGQAVFFSFFVNILMLVPSWYMLEVYERVVASQNHRTLIMLTLLVVILYAFLEMLGWIRSRIMQKAANQFEISLRERVFNCIFQAKLRQLKDISTQPLDDLRIIQDAIASPALMAIIDMPFAILTLLLIFWINATLGWIAVLGASVLGVLAVINQIRVQPHLVKANQHAIAAQNYAGAVLRNAQVIKSMGMLQTIHQKWIQKQHEFLNEQAIASNRAGLYASLSKFINTLQGSLLLGLGCWLTLKGELGMGGSMMIIASILGGRVLAPLFSIVSQWRVILGAKNAFNRLDNFLGASTEDNLAMPLPPPVGNLSVKELVACAPNSQTPILKGITFKLAAGESLGIVGPSASGKSTLARLITGIWPASSGIVRLDGVDIYEWEKIELGPYVGYLPQNIELFDGTLAENIARFNKVDMPKVIEAAKIVGLNNFVLSLKDGYETELGNGGAFLSGGQRQRVALARAIYGMPKFIVLDEPNSNLDEEGDAALIHTIKYIKSMGATVVIITHRIQILSIIDSILVLAEGQLKAVGPKDEILKLLTNRS